MRFAFLVPLLLSAPLLTGGGLAGAGLAGNAAWAADLPVGSDPVPASLSGDTDESFSWSGLYAGVFGGYGWGELDTDYSLFDTPLVSATTESDGFLAGATLGYNWEFGRAVLGLEAEAGYLDLEDETALARGLTSTTSGGGYGILAGRVGIGLDRFLAYAKGGLAVSALQLGLVTTPPDDSIRTDDIAVGFAVGGGLEYAFGRHWTAKAEYQYLDLGDKDGAYDDFTADYDLDADTVKFGLNYKF